nr:hypothetical protein [Mycoplasmopsis bovis]QQH18990.1 hypothetical protein HYE48_00920 [Mycoplasmopsis bovis]
MLNEAMLNMTGLIEKLYCLYKKRDIYRIAWLTSIDKGDDLATWRQ